MVMIVKKDFLMLSNMYQTLLGTLRQNTTLLCSSDTSGTTMQYQILKYLDTWKKPILQL